MRGEVPFLVLQGLQRVRRSKKLGAFRASVSLSQWVSEISAFQALQGPDPDRTGRLGERGACGHRSQAGASPRRMLWHSKPNSFEKQSIAKQVGRTRESGTVDKPKFASTLS